MATIVRRSLAVLSGCGIAASVLFFATQLLHAQSQEKPDPFERIIPSFQLNRQNIFEAVAKLNESTGIVVSVERVLDAKDAKNVDSEFTATIAGGKPSAVLNEICDLDARYTWARDGNLVNIFPRRVVGDREYLFNRKIPVLQLKDATDAPSAALDAVRALPGPTAQLIVLEFGKLDFEKPWTTTIEDINLRQAINRIAEHLCATCGWQLSGTTETPTIMFYRRLQTSAPVPEALLAPVPPSEERSERGLWLPTVQYLRVERLGILV
jgi:hypothetical protein